MTSTESSISSRQRIAIASLWVLTVLECLGMALAGASKFANAELWTGMFVGWGYPAWFAFVIGGTEILGAVLLLAPKLATYAAGLLTVVMVGALATVVINSSSLGVTAPIAHLVVLAIIGGSRRRRRWRRER